MATKKKKRSTTYRKIYKLGNEVEDILFEIEEILDEKADKLSDKEWQKLREYFADIGTKMIDLFDLTGSGGYLEALKYRY